MKKSASLLLMLSIVGIVSACSKSYSEVVIDSSIEDTQIDTTKMVTTEPSITKNHTIETLKNDREPQNFGENSIVDQTFEVELSEYNGKVSFVPFAPSEENSEFSMQIIQDGNVLTDIPAYVPVGLAEEGFTSLDAVSFYDVNFDGNTDIVLIETYGNTSFAAVYYGFDSKENYEQYFIPQEQLSENISNQVTPLTIPEIRKYLSGGKKNGEFSSYQEAYDVISRLCNLEGSEEKTYRLIYFDNDDIPELVAGVNGFYISLYTYKDGKAYTLMDRWVYGVMGNAGYEYSPRKNSLRNYNTDYAGAILYTTYMAVSDQHTMDTIVQIQTYNFDDANENGIPDEEEMGSMGIYGVNYINGEVVSDEICASYDVGGYEEMGGTMSFEILRAELGRQG